MLITCPECGKSASDTAKTCPHCGFAFKKCDECGSIIAAEAQVCANCGFEFAQKTAEKKPASKTTETKKCDPEKERKRLFSQEEKKARKVASYIEKLNSIFKWAMRGVSLLAIILIGIAAFKLIDFVSYKKKSPDEVLKLLVNAQKIQDSIHALLVAGIVCLIFVSFAKSFKTFFYSWFVHNKITAEGFRYKTFYENYPVDENGEVLPPMFELSDNLFEHTDIQLTEIIRYKDDLPSLALKLLRNAIGLFLLVLGAILIYPVITNNVDSIMALAILGEESSFKIIFDSKLIWGAAVIVLKFVLVDLILDRDMEEAHEWLKKLHKNKQPDTENLDENE